MQMTHAKIFQSRLLFVLLTIFTVFQVREGLASDADFAARRGLVFLETGDYVAAIGAFDEAIKISTNYSYAYYSRGLAKFHLNQIKDVISDCGEAIRCDFDGSAPLKSFA